MKQRRSEPAVYNIAEELSSQHTASNGFRSLDLLHVVTALHLKAEHFLTSDTRQAVLAKTVGLKVQP